MKGTNDVVLTELFENMIPGIASTEEEADKREVVRVCSRGNLVILKAERENGDIKVENSRVSEPEFVKRDDGS